MVIRYVDPEDGLDTNDGSTFALRKKTLANATIGLTAGSEVRIIASPPPASLGALAWTDNSGVIPIPAGLVTEVESFDSAWTGAANVTATTVTTTRKSGTGMVNLNVAAIFTTGKLAYRTFPSALDLSAFGCLSVWWSSSLVLPAGALELRLCSDALGDVAVATMPLTDARLTHTANEWRITLKDFGGVLPSGVNSIAIWAISDPGTLSQLRFDNLIACKRESDPQHLSHVSLLGKNTAAEPEWYPLQSLTDTGVTIGASNGTLIGNVLPRPYRGPTESVETFAIRPLKPWTTAERTTTSNTIFPVTVSGGWSRADMSVQTGVTWMTGLHAVGSLLTTGSSGWDFSKLGAAHYQTAPFVISASNSYDFEGALACIGFTTLSVGNDNRPGRFRCRQVWGASTSTPVNTLYPVDFRFGRIHGNTGVTAGGVSPFGTMENGRMKLRIDKVDNNAGFGLLTPTVNYSDVVLVGTIFENNPTDIRTSGASPGTLKLDGCMLNSPTPYSFAPTTDSNLLLAITNYNGDTKDHRFLRPNISVATDQTVRHSALGYSWKLSIATVLAASAWFPAEFQLGLVALRAGTAATIGAWVRRDDLGLTAGIKIPRDYAPGGEDLIATASAAINTWELLTLTFTPTRDGVLPVTAWGYGGTTFNAWFDDLEVSQ